jgi:hypothetical protein
MVKQLHTEHVSFYLGATPNIFGVGFEIGKYGMNLTLAFFWFSIEW